MTEKPQRRSSPLKNGDPMTSPTNPGAPSSRVLLIDRPAELEETRIKLYPLELALMEDFLPSTRPAGL